MESLFRDEATKEVLRFIGNTDVSRPMIKEETRDDYWDIERLDRGENEEREAVDDERG